MIVSDLAASAFGGKQEGMMIVGGIFGGLLTGLYLVLSGTLAHLWALPGGLAIGAIVGAVQAYQSAKRTM